MHMCSYATRMKNEAPIELLSNLLLVKGKVMPPQQTCQERGLSPTFHRGCKGSVNQKALSLNGVVEWMEWKLCVDLCFQKWSVAYN